ncbi:hypothetical protein HYS47_00455 [Candidatus Woesearchaeota archaeon]|nr:hypothetical protein [Candidatus Woesearchaeota archaeon]
MDTITVKRFKVMKVDRHEKLEQFDIYSDYGVEEECENDEVSPSEEGFMKGYLAA